MLFVLLNAFPVMANQYSVMDKYMDNVSGKTIYTPIIKINGNKWCDMVYYRGKFLKKGLKYDKTLLDVSVTDYAISITPKKSGLSKVVFKTREDGKTKKYSFYVKSFKLKASPIMSLKFGKKEVINDLCFNNINQYAFATPNIYSKGKDTAKIVIKARSGWKVKSAVSVTRANEKETQKKLNLKKKITVKRDSNIVITMVDKKGNEVFYNIFGMLNNG